jgi:hypothetical protein
VEKAGNTILFHADSRGELASSLALLQAENLKTTTNKQQTLKSKRRLIALGNGG